MAPTPRLGTGESSTHSSLTIPPKTLTGVESRRGIRDLSVSDSEKPTDPTTERLSSLARNEQWSDLALELIQIQNDPRYTRQHAIYSLILSVYDREYQATPPEFFFARVDAASPYYEEAIRLMIRYYYASVGDLWTRAVPLFRKLHDNVKKSGRVLPSLFLLRFLAGGPDLSYEATSAAYNDFLAQYGKYYGWEHNILGTVVMWGEATNVLEIIPIPVILLLYNQQLAIAAYREGRFKEKLESIQRVNGLVNDYFAGDWKVIRSRIDSYCIQPSFLEKQRRELEKVGGSSVEIPRLRIHR